MIEALQNFKLDSLPTNWIAYRSEECLCELWCPSDWKFDPLIPQPKIFKPPFTRIPAWRKGESHTIGDYIYIDSPLFDFSPVVTMFGMPVNASLRKQPEVSSNKDEIDKIKKMIKPLSTIAEEHVLENIFYNTAKGFADKKFQLINKEKGLFRGRRSLYLNFSYVKGNNRWEGFLLYQCLGDKLWYADATGVADDMEKYCDTLKKVVASLRTYESPSEFHVVHATISI